MRERWMDVNDTPEERIDLHMAFTGLSGYAFQRLALMWVGERGERGALNTRNVLLYVHFFFFS
jgi:hypothetical protein